MTYLDVLNIMQNKPFHSETFWGETVTITNTIEIRGENGNLELITGKDDLKALLKEFFKTYPEFRKQLSNK